MWWQRMEETNDIAILTHVHNVDTGYAGTSLIMAISTDTYDLLDLWMNIDKKYFRRSLAFFINRQSQKSRTHFFHRSTKDQALTSTHKMSENTRNQTHKKCEFFLRFEASPTKCGRKISIPYDIKAATNACPRIISVQHDLKRKRAFFQHAVKNESRAQSGRESPLGDGGGKPDLDRVQEGLLGGQEAR